jgi:(R)-2-hydroxyacyl-CoA dehydratese activating ATPase
VLGEKGELMSWFMGIDIGSGSSKGVITGDGQIRAYHLVPSGVNYRLSAETLRTALLSQLGLSWQDIKSTVVTGQGAASVLFSQVQAADIRCCARGINRLFPDIRTVVDIQGQSSQVIRINGKGQVINFVAGEKCAGGSGRFLDIIANVLQVELKDIGEIAMRSAHPVVFTTGCAVFGESEAISRVAEGIPKEDILAGVLQALAERIAAFADRIGLEEPCAVCGGGALNAGLVQKIEEKLGVRLQVPPQPQIINALGAAVIAEEQVT